MKSFSQILFQFFLVFALVLGLGPQSFARMERPPSKIADPLEYKASRAMVQLVRNEYRMAIHITERLLACFTNDKEWFQASAVDGRDNSRHCKSYIKSIRSKVKGRLSKMRIYLALSMVNKAVKPGVFGTYNDHLYQVPQQPHELPFLFSNSPTFAADNNHSIHPWVSHSFSADVIAPLTDNEIQQGMDILNNDLAWVYHHHWGEEPSRSPVCFNPELRHSSLMPIPEDAQKRMSPRDQVFYYNDGIGAAERACYYDKYLAMIFGGGLSEKPWTQGIEGFPLLAYFEDSDTGDESIVRALKKRLLLTKKSKIEFENEYYVPSSDTEGIRPRSDLNIKNTVDLYLYEDLADRLARQNKNLQEYVEVGKKSFRKKRMVRMFLTIGAVVASIPICLNIFTGSLARGLCMMPFGLGFNGYMVYTSEKRLRQAVDDMLMSPHGLRTLNHIDAIEDYQFSKNLDWLLLPVGTGVFSVARGFSQFRSLSK